MGVDTYIAGVCLFSRFHPNAVGSRVLEIAFGRLAASSWAGA